MKEKKNSDLTEDSFTLNKNTIGGTVFYNIYLHNVESVTTKDYDDPLVKHVTCEAKRNDGKNIQIELSLFADDMKKLVFKRIKRRKG